MTDPYSFDDGKNAAWHASPRFKPENGGVAMADDRQLELKRPWTPGKWEYENAGTDEWTWYPNNKYEGYFDGPTEADMKLICLAPEIAEAILAWDNDPTGSGGVEPLSVLAEKLRSIG